LCAIRTLGSREARSGEEAMVFWDRSSWLKANKAGALCTDERQIGSIVSQRESTRKV
jgi:hypothetical protein